MMLKAKVLTNFLALGFILFTGILYAILMMLVH
jgi:hypothetical protein